MDLNIQSVKVGPERTNCYVVSLSSGETVIIDPGAEFGKISELLARIKNLDIKYILFTHGHFDHVGAVDDLNKLYPEVPVMISEEDVDLYWELPEQGIFVGRILKGQHAELTAIRGGQFLPFGDDEIKVISTPGHTPGGVCYQIGGNLFTGDTLFYHTIGRTDLPHSDNQRMLESLDLLLHLDEKLVVFPGHGMQTTISEERENNPYVKESFPH